MCRAESSNRLERSYPFPTSGCCECIRDDIVANRLVEPRVSGVSRAVIGFAPTIAKAIHFGSKTPHFGLQFISLRLDPLMLALYSLNLVLESDHTL